MKIVFLGSGNVATHLSQALNHSMSDDVVQVYSPTAENAKSLAELLSCGYCTDINDVDVNADIYICSVKDSAQRQVWLALKKHFNESDVNLAEKIVVHTAGALAMNGEDGLSNVFPNCGVVYPVQSFSKQRAVDLSHTPFLIEATNPSTLEKLRRLVATVSDRCYEATTRQRNALHPAAVFASNFANHMYAIGEKLMQDANLSFDMLLPLINETSKKVNTVSPKLAQTGPAVRYDRNVIDKHLAALSNEPNLQEIYQLLTKNIHKFATE